MPSLSPREELLKIQRRLWGRNKDIIEHSILVKESGFTRYQRKYLRSVANYECVATNDEMLNAVRNARIVYAGDYHTCNQSQRSFLRILKVIVPEDPKSVLALELIHSRHQKVLDIFMKDQITEETFIKKVGLRQHWVFNLWNNFKPLFDFAKYHKLPVVGVDAAPLRASLKERDEATARLIAKLLEKYPEHKIFVMIGDLHLAHLPERVEQLCPSTGSGRAVWPYVVLYQNSESIYWKLAEHELEDRVEVVKINDNAYCRMHTPPIVCQQSYINWLEHEEGEIDYSDARASFLELADRIAKFLELDIEGEREKVEVFTCGDLSFFKRLKESGKFTARELKVLKRQILSSESYYIAEKRFVYLANLSINHAAEEAAHFIKHAASGVERPRTPTDAFFANILHEALAFFGSKLVNHKRKCLHEREFKNLITYFKAVQVPQERRLEFETAHLVLDFLKSGVAREEDIQIPDLFFSSTHALGYMLGDRLFYAMMSEAITKEEIKELFLDPWRKRGEPQVVYVELIKRLKHIRIPRRV